MPVAAVAAVAGGALAAGGSIIAANKNSKAIDKSTDASLQANRESIAAQQAALDQQLAFQTSALNQSNSFNTQAYNNSGKLQTDVLNQNYGILNPYAQTGYAAMNGINGILGLPEQQAYTPKNIKFTPISVDPITAPTSGSMAAQTPAANPAQIATGTAPSVTAWAAARGMGY